MENLTVMNCEDFLKIETETIYHVEPKSNSVKGVGDGETDYTGLTLTSSVIY